MFGHPAEPCVTGVMGPEEVFQGSSPMNHFQISFVSALHGFWPREVVPCQLQGQKTGQSLLCSY